MKKNRRIKSEKEFQFVFKKGKSFANKQIVIYVISKTDQTNFRIGLSVSKKIGNAVVRNRIKRYLRQSFIEIDPLLIKNIDIIVIARSQLSKFNFFEVKSSLIHILKRASLIEGKISNSETK
ncbi:MAG: rnpA [Bacillales bacterium]|nr:rnpA [Bacillales bacterium]